MAETTTEKLERVKKELDEHYASAPERIREYYNNPGGSDFETAPHDQQFQYAAQYIEFAIRELHVPEQYREVEVADRFQYMNAEDRSVQWKKRRRWARQHIEDMLYGIVVELLVSAVHLNIDTEDYIENMIEDDQNRTPHVRESKERLLEDLEGNIDDEAIAEIELVLDIAKDKRNNLVHFGFHYQGAHYFPALFIDVCGFLITRYADTDEIPELETMAEYRAAYERRRGDTEQYRLSIDFEPFS